MAYVTCLTIASWYFVSILLFACLPPTPIIYPGDSTANAIVNLNSMNLRFVDNNAIDDVARKQIRSHVMLGKNTCKKKPGRRPQKKIMLTPRSILKKDLAQSSASSESETNIETVSISKPFGDALAYFTFPVQLNVHMTYLIRQFMWAQIQSIYPIEFCIPMETHKSLWFRFLQSSESCKLHSIVFLRDLSLTE